MEIIFFIFGIVFGSFFNVIIDRLPENESILKGRSHCDFCKKQLRWFELIPLFSFIFQMGKCLRCGKKLSFQYPLVEFITGLIFVYAFILGNDNLVLILAYIVIFSSFIINFMVDLKYQILLDSMICLTILGSIIRIFVLNPFSSLWLPFLGAGLGAGGFFFILWFMTRGRGMGFGDVKLGFALGIFLGYPWVIYALYTAFLTGAFLGVILIMLGKKKLKSQVAFGPFLIVGSIIALQYGNILTGWLKGIIW
jgi:leader peptidase (prepilin peptidase) / N-methyltransferase